MAGNKLVIFLLRAEERLAHGDIFPVRNDGEPRRKLVERFLPDLARIHRRADRHETGRRIGEDRVFVIEFQRRLERLAQRLQKEERAAEKEHLPLDPAPLREPGDRLIDDRLKDGGGNIRLARALVEEGLDIRLCEHAAARGDGIYALRFEREGVHLLHRDVEERRHLVDERARAARAAAVHALFGSARHENDLGVLPAQLHRRVRIRIQFADGAVCRLHLLHERDLSALSDAKSCRARDTRLESIRNGADLFQFAQHTFFYARIVAHIGGIEDLPLFIQHAHFHRRRSDVNSE